MQKPNIQTLTNFLIEYVSIMLSSGTYTSRIAKCVDRITRVYGYEIHINFFFHHFTLNIVDRSDKSSQRTYVVPTKSENINFKLISDLSALSWAIYDKRYSLEYAQETFKELISQKKHSSLSRILFISVANSAFCRLFGGDFGGCLFVLFGTLAGLFFRYIFTRLKINIKIQYIFCSFITSWVVFLGIDLNFVKEANVALGSSILYLTPGVFFINSIIDILKDHILMGLSRIISVIILVCCISIGIYMTLSISNLGILQ